MSHLEDNSSAYQRGGDAANWSAEERRNDYIENYGEPLKPRNIDLMTWMEVPRPWEPDYDHQKHGYEALDAQGF